jgi:hypothetical protein
MTGVGSAGGLRRVVVSLPELPEYKVMTRGVASSTTRAASIVIRFLGTWYTFKYTSKTGPYDRAKVGMHMQMSVYRRYWYKASDL